MKLIGKLRRWTVKKKYQTIYDTTFNHLKFDLIKCFGTVSSPSIYLFKIDVMFWCLYCEL